VINFSSFDLDPFVLRLLNTGINFALAPRKILVDDIICKIEFGIRDLLDNDMEVIQQDCIIVLSKVKSPKSNISKNEFLPLKTLRDNPNIVILKVDKGGASFILDNDDYVNKMIDHLHNSRNYIKLKKNPLKRVSKEIAKSLLKEILLPPKFIGS